MRAKIGLALGGGGALGFCHIGVLDEFVKAKIPIDYIAGISMGALVGGVYASGTSIQEMNDFAIKMRTYHLASFNMNGAGMFNGNGIERMIKNLTKDKSIEEGVIPFRCGATDLVTGKRYTFTNGKYYEALRASMSVPTLFVPVYKDDMVLVDGGVVDNIPDEMVKDMGADIVVSIAPFNEHKLHDKLVFPWQCVTYAYLLTMLELSKERANCSDILIEPKLSEYKQFEFNKKASMAIIEEGRRIAQEYIPIIKEKIKEWNKTHKEKIEK